MSFLLLEYSKCDHALTITNMLYLSVPMQGSAKLEKAEILQMTVDHLRHLHQSRDARGRRDTYMYNVHVNPGEVIA